MFEDEHFGAVGVRVLFFRQLTEYLIKRLICICFGDYLQLTNMKRNEREITMRIVDSVGCLSVETGSILAHKYCFFYYKNVAKH